MSGAWLIAVVFIALICIIIRYVILSKDGVLSETEKETLSSTIRENIFDIIEATEILGIYKDTGNIGAKIYINRKLREYIEITPILTNDERSIILRMDLSFFIDLIESELKKLGVVKE
jgi:hypothetical protein